MSEYELPPVQRVSNETIRKLPKIWKAFNLGYQIFMVLLGFANIVLTTLDERDDINIPPMYFKIYSCIISYSFVVWSRILDEVKVAEDISSPRTSTRNTPRSMASVSPQSLSHNDSEKSLNDPIDRPISEPTNNESSNIQLKMVSNEV